MLVINEFYTFNTQNRIRVFNRKLLILTLVAFVLTVSASFWMASIILQSEEPYSVSSKLESIANLASNIERQNFAKKLTANQKFAVASKVRFVSAVIGQSNRKVDRNKLASSIVEESIMAKVDPLLIAAVIKSESGFKSSAVSVKGARGLMQLMPGTAKFTQQILQPTSWRITIPFFSRSEASRKPDSNISLGITYLKHLEKEFSGNRELALIAYNWGPANLKTALKNRTHIPEESRQYAKQILRNHQKWSGQLNFQTLASRVNPSKEVA